MTQDLPSVQPGPSPRPRRPYRIVAGIAAVLTLCAAAGLIVGAALLLQARADRRIASAVPKPAVVELDPGTQSGPEEPGDPAQVDPAQPAPALALSDLPGRLVFVDADRQVATIAPDGSKLRQLTDDGRTYQFPAWAPDGSQVAVIGGSGVYVMADSLASGAVPKSVYFSTSQSPIYLYWSPDSSQISLLANHPAGLGLHLAPADGGETRLLATGQPFYWAWSPSADEILVHAGGSRDGATLASVDPASGTVGANIARPGVFQPPGISSSGERWAYVEEEDDGRRSLVVLQRDDGLPSRLPQSGSVALTWSPTEEKLAFIGPEVGETQPYGPLRLYDALRGNTVALSTQTVVAFFWAPDGRTIAYLTVHGRNTIEAALPQPPVSKGRLGRHLGQTDGMPILDLWLVDVDTGQEAFLASLEPTPLFVAQFLPFFDQYALSHRVWSPDGRALVLPARVDGTSQILVLPVDGRPPTAVARGTMAFWSHD